MKIRHSIIAVLVCFMLSLNIAEAIPTTDTGHQHSQNWHQGSNHKWYKRWYKRWHKRWHSSQKAPNISTSFGTGVAAVFSDMHHDLNEHKPSNLPSKGGTFLSGVGQDMQKCLKAPEISVASATSAIALLAGIMLLFGESSRARRS